MAATAAARRLAAEGVAAAPARSKRPRSGAASPARRRSRPAAGRRPSAARARSRRAQAHPQRGQLIPLAVGRTAVAVRRLPEARLVHRMTRGQLWIGVLGTLLSGIVALNVVSLSLSTSSGRVAQQVAGLEQQNSELRARLAMRLSDQRIQDRAGLLGLVVPDPGQIRYLTAGERYAEIAARRLGAGDFTVSGALAPLPAATAPTAVAPTPADATAATAPAPSPTTTTTAAAPPPTAPATTAPPQPVAPAPAPAGGGGVAAP